MCSRNVHQLLALVVPEDHRLQRPLSRRVTVSFAQAAESALIVT
jgi:hypothetical protein